MPKEHLIGKLDTHPYGRLLAFAANCTLESGPFTKAQATSHAVSDEEFEQYISFVCDNGRDGTYVVKFRALRDYLSYVEMATTKRSANIALWVALLAIVVSIILAVAPLLKEGKPVRLTEDQFNTLTVAAQQPVKLQDLPIIVRLDESQLAQIKQLREDENRNPFRPKDKHP